MNYKEIEKLNMLFNKHMSKLDNYTLCIICNKKQDNTTTTLGQYNYDTEYLSENEFEQIVNLFSQIKINTEYFLNEDEFINFYFKIPQYRQKKLIVYNAAQSGTGAGRKSLIPAFCNLHNIICTGSDAYVVSLCRHKYHVNKILASAGIAVPQTYLYSDKWAMDSSPGSNEKIILKPIYESASIGIDSNSVIEYTPSLDKTILKRVKELKQPFIAQKFITGYEVENPVIIIKNSIFTLPPVGLSCNGELQMGKRFLDYSKIYNDDYGFFDFRDIAKIKFDETIKNTVKILNMYGLCRIDFRIDEKQNYYITDVSTNPHFINHSSVHHSFLYNGLDKVDIVRSILTAAIAR